MNVLFAFIEHIKYHRCTSDVKNTGMSEKSGIKLSDAFNRSLKELAINEFPCGNGKWVYAIIVSLCIGMQKI